MPHAHPRRRARASLAAVAVTALLGCADAEIQREVFSETYTVDRIYRSMRGPASRVELPPLDRYAAPELVWLTGYTAEIVGEDGTSPRSAEFMCHSDLDLDPVIHRERFGEIRPGWRRNQRLFTVSQGQLEIDFPEGFGLPVMSDEALSLTTQVLNLNMDEGSDKMRFRINVDTVRDADTQGTPMKPLFSIGGYVMVVLDDEPAVYGEAHPTAEVVGAGCLPGESAAHGAMNTNQTSDSAGRVFSGHFVVKPGRHVFRTLVTDQMKVPYDTTVHYINVHVHPFAESLELRDLTTNESVYKANVTNYTDRIGIEHVDHYSSTEGVAIYRDHEYEMVSVYHNTTEDDHDAMAVFRMYALEKDFKGPVDTALQ